MRDFSLRFLLVLLAAAGSTLRAEPPPPAAEPLPKAEATPKSAPPAKGEKKLPVTETLPEAQIDGVLQLLKSNYLDGSVLDGAAMKRAELRGVLAMLKHGAELIPTEAAASDAVRPALGEMLDGNILYYRLGSLDPTNIAALDDALAKAGPELAAVVLDLRDTPFSTNYEAAAEVAKRFVEKGKPLFQLKSPRTNQAQLFTANAEPAYTGTLMLVTDSETRGASEVIAAVLRKNAKRAMIVGAKTGGEAVQYADFAVDGGKATLKVAVARVELPTGETLFPVGIEPDIDVTMDREVQRDIFERTAKLGMKKFIVDIAPVRMNEAALVSGSNPHLEDYMKRNKAGAKSDEPLPRDVVLQRAVDVVTAVSVLGKQ